jgi:hypothetical protein
MKPEATPAARKRERTVANFIFSVSMGLRAPLQNQQRGKSFLAEFVVFACAGKRGGT